MTPEQRGGNVRSSRRGQGAIHVRRERSGDGLICRVIHLLDIISVIGYKQTNIRRGKNPEKTRKTAQQTTAPKRRPIIIRAPTPAPNYHQGMPRTPETTTPGDATNRTADEIRAEMGRQHTSGLKLAAACGISQNYLAKRLRGEASLTFNDVEAIAAVLNIEPAAILTPGR